MIPFFQIPRIKQNLTSRQKKQRLKRLRLQADAMRRYQFSSQPEIIIQPTSENRTYEINEKFFQDNPYPVMADLATGLNLNDLFELDEVLVDAWKSFVDYHLFKDIPYDPYFLTNLMRFLSKNEDSLGIEGVYDWESDEYMMSFGLADLLRLDDDPRRVKQVVFLDGNPSIELAQHRLGSGQFVYIMNNKYLFVEMNNSNFRLIGFITKEWYRNQITDAEQIEFHASQVFENEQNYEITELQFVGKFVKEISLDSITIEVFVPEQITTEYVEENEYLQFAYEIIETGYDDTIDESFAFNYYRDGESFQSKYIDIANLSGETEYLQDWVRERDSEEALTFWEYDKPPIIVNPTGVLKQLLDVLVSQGIYKVS